MNWTERLQRDRLLLEGLPAAFRPVVARVGVGLVRGEARWGVIFPIKQADAGVQLSVLVGGTDERVAELLAAEIALFHGVEARGVPDDAPVVGVQANDAFYQQALRDGLIYPGSGSGLQAAYQWLVAGVSAGGG